MKRILTLDIAKAICIILVVVGHYIPENSPDWYVLTRAFIYSFHMPLFMFASGFIYMATRKDIGYGEFVQKKFRRLMIPYFTTSVIVITIKLITQGNAYIENPVTVMSYVKMLYSPEAGYFLWFIWALWWMFVIVPLFKTQRQRLILLAIALFLAYIPFQTTEIFCIKEFKHMFVYFVLGVVMAEHRQVIWQYVSRYTYIIYLLFVGVEVLHLTNVNGGGTQ